MREWRLVLVGVVVLMLLKAFGIYVVARLFKSDHGEALYRMVLMAQGGEFAFVLYSAAATAGILDATTNATLTAIVIVSMAITPLGVFALRWLLPRETRSMEGVEEAHDLKTGVLVIGFGRFGQVASQSLLARGLDVTIIDNDTDMIRSAAEFGFKVYYGDGTRLDVLRACGAANARAIAVCVDDRVAASRIVELVNSEFPHAHLLARSFDREHALKLIAAGVEYQIRETFESAMAFGEAALKSLGVPETEAAVIVADVRRRDAERLQLEMTGGIYAGADMLHGNAPKPRPLVAPKHKAKALSDETAAVTGSATRN